ncbi:3-oxoacyl-[acyl-carrier-protein] reductase FabG-like [Dysidea avara]|uniref:3-oxoacyl-[acyl-carrier-protein] reductase FabG-like n=1 Tax=Dysidea avara TaxID=196820 RepID=UPI00332B1DDB
MFRWIALAQNARKYGWTYSKNASYTTSVMAIVTVSVGTGMFLYKQYYTLHALEVRESTKRFVGQTVVITGAAGDIGSATAKAFACEGAKVMLVDLASTVERMEKLCKELQTLGASQAEWTACDVSDVEQVSNMVENSVKKFGGINFLFNNAGIQGSFAKVDKQSDAAFKRLININIYGMFLVMKYTSQAMIQAANGGVIVNTSSLAGLLGPPNMIAYATSKFAVVGMTKSAAKDLAEHNIRVCAIAPGLIDGKMWYTQVKGQAQCRKGTSTISDDEIQQHESRMITSVPMKRLGKLEEIASVVLFLCSKDASYLTGTVIPIDGGKLQ